MKSEPSLSPNRLPWPPMIVAAAIVSAATLNMIVPLSAGANIWLRAFGGLFGGLGIALDLWAILTMRSAGTNILPHRSANHLVIRGPFAVTRNPIYAGNTLLLLGIGLCFGNLWFVIFGLGGALAVDRLAIRREEHHLAALFGDEWTRYSSRVPRWLI
jgi:protein-S-isoprenylcysteine O-methyltransferase Ste14